MSRLEEKDDYQCYDLLSASIICCYGRGRLRVVERLSYEEDIDR